MGSSVPTIFPLLSCSMTFFTRRRLTNFYHLSAEVQGLKTAQKEINLFPL